MLEKRAWAKKHADAIRRALMLEPRGHADMYGAVLTEPVTGRRRRRRAVHAQRGLQHDVRPRHHRRDDDGDRARPDSSRGSPNRDRLRHARRARARPRASRRRIEGEGGRACVSIASRSSTCRRSSSRRACRSAWATASSAWMSRSAAPSTPSSTPRRPGCRSTPARLPELRRARHGDRARGRERRPPSSTRVDPGLKGIYGTIFTGPPERDGADLRNVTVFADAEVDRSPCGTGTCAVMAVTRRDGPAAGRAGPSSTRASSAPCSREGQRAGRAVGDRRRHPARNRGDPPGSPASTRS